MMGGKREHSSQWGCVSVVLVLVIAIAAIVGAFRCTFRVPKGHVAVLMTEVGGVGDGLQDKVLREGLHFYNPLITDYFVVSIAVQTLMFGAQAPEPGPRGLRMGATDHWRRPATSYWADDRRIRKSDAQIRDANVEMRFPEGPIRTKTKDGEDVELKATLVLRISENSAPQFVRFVGGDVAKLRDLYLIPGARSIIRTVFGQLNSGSFFSSTERGAKAEECLSVLNDFLRPAGVLVEGFTLDHFAFDREFHTFLQDLKILNQRIGSVGEQREASLDQMRQEFQRVEATAKLKVAAAEREVEMARIDAEETIEQMERQAEAVRLRLRREADLARERGAAMSGPGGEAALRLELAKALNGKPIVIVPDDAANLGESLPELLKLLLQPPQPASP